MKNKTQGFTLIELLIVIAIIGILAAVLIPQLLGARVSANKRAFQAHSANVFKVVNAYLADNSTFTAGGVVTGLGAACLVEKVSTATYTINTLPATGYGYSAAPGGVTVCTIAAPTTGSFTVTVDGDPGDGGAVWRSINGGNPVKQ